MATINITDALLTNTTIRAAQEARDQDYLDTPFTACQEAVHGKGAPSRNTGVRWLEGLGVGSHSEPTAMRDGYERINMNFRQTLKPFIFRPFELVFPIGISELEEEANQGEDATIELAAYRTKKVMAEARRRFEQYIMQGPLAAKVAEFSDFGHLNGVDYTTGVLEGVAPGAQVNSYGGVNKGSYQTTPGLQNRFANVGGNFSSGGLRALTTITHQLKLRAEHGLDGLAWFASENGLSHYHSTLQVQERYKMGEKKDGVTGDLLIAGVPVKQHPYMALTGANTAALPISFMSVDFNSVYFCWGKYKRDGCFGMGPWERIGNGYNVRMAQVLVKGQLWTKGFGSSALVVNAENY